MLSPELSYNLIFHSGNLIFGYQFFEEIIFGQYNLTLTLRIYFLKK